MKTIATLFIATTFIACSKDNINKSPALTIESTENIVTSTAAHYIGERFGGGLIFWLDATGEHGLITTVGDLGLAKWRGSKFIVTGATGTTIGTGPANTRKIIAAQGRGSYAATMCTQYSNDGYSDWYLPSKDELNALFLQKNVIGGAWADGYWSSTEEAKHFAWYQYFPDGYQDYFLKINSVSVRPIRSF